MLVEWVQIFSQSPAEEFGLVCGQYLAWQARNLELTICGMMVMLVRRTSRLTDEVGRPSKMTFPSVKMHRKRDNVNELWRDC